MLLLNGTRSNDNLYGGIKHYDNKPLSSRDLHDKSDILYRKSAFFTNSLLGSGILNKPKINITSSNQWSISEPIVLLLDGDISLIYSDNFSIDNPNNIHGDTINEARVEYYPEYIPEEFGYDEYAHVEYIGEGVLCLVGWYQILDHNTTLRAYGGVNNDPVENDIYDDNFETLISSRVQLRWDTVAIDKRALLSGNPISFVLYERDANGDLIYNETDASLEYHWISSLTNKGSYWTAPAPDTMNYAFSDLYIIPLFNFNYKGLGNSGYTEGEYSDISLVSPLKVSGGLGDIVKSEEEPVKELEEGLVWYHPDSRRFRFYMKDVGFVPTAPDISLVQYTETLPIEHDEQVDFHIGSTSYQPGDLLQVFYNGLLLNKEDYSINTDSTELNLLGFDPSIKMDTEGKLTLIITRLKVTY